MTDNQLYETGACPSDMPAPQLFLSPATAAHLRRGAVWARFMAVVGFIGCGVMLLASIAMLAFSGFLSAYISEMIPYASVILAVLYIVSAVIGFFINLFLYRFADRSIRAVDSSDSALLSSGIRNLTNLFLTSGIILFMSLAIPAIATIIALIF